MTHHVSYFLAGPFVHPKLLPVAFSKALFKLLQKPSAEVSSWLLALYWLMYDQKSFFTLPSCSFHVFLLGTLFLLVSFTLLITKSQTNDLRWVIHSPKKFLKMHSSLGKTSISFKNFRRFLLIKQLAWVFDGPDSCN